MEPKDGEWNLLAPVIALFSTLLSKRGPIALPRQELLIDPGSKGPKREGYNPITAQAEISIAPNPPETIWNILV